MEILITYGPITLAIAALIVSCLALRARRREYSLQYSKYIIDANIAVEEKLAQPEWESAFELYGIDLDGAEREGVTKHQILYLALCLNFQSSRAQALGLTVSEYIDQTSWRQRMLGQDITKRTWKYVRHMFADFTVADVDDWYTCNHPSDPDHS
jgi:hypothetical protein